MARMNSAEANSSSPCAMKNIPAVAATPSSRKNAMNRFFAARTSATAPRTGPSTATTTAAMVLAYPHHCVATSGGLSAPATLRKKIGNTAVVITVCIAEMAQS